MGCLGLVLSCWLGFLLVLWFLFCGSILVVFFIIWVSMSHIPVSAITISAGVVIGVLRIRFSTLFSILCRVSSSFLVGVHISAP